MPLPDLTHLQYLVMLTIGGIERPGRDVREKLAEEGQRTSLRAWLAARDLWYRWPAYQRI